MSVVFQTPSLQITGLVWRQWFEFPSLFCGLGNSKHTDPFVPLIKGVGGSLQELVEEENGKETG